MKFKLRVISKPDYKAIYNNKYISDVTGEIYLFKYINGRYKAYNRWMDIANKSFNLTFEHIRESIISYGWRVFDEEPEGWRVDS